jgi:predicted DNA-binding protein (MmcQ/YjbR family)
MDEIIMMVETLAGTTRPMFGYQCYSVGGKFFAGFGKRNNLIIRLSKELQSEALRDKRLKIRPFSHGARMGWVELDAKSMANSKAVFDWIRKGYEHALRLSRKD